MSTRSTPLAKGTNNDLWEKMWIFKRKYKEYAKKVRILEEEVAATKQELSLSKGEIQKEIEVKQTSVLKYQQVLKALVDVEDKYCKLLSEKKTSDEELAAEKKLRLELQSSSDVCQELNLMQAHAVWTDKNAEGDNMELIENQKKEISGLKENLIETVKQYEEQLGKVKQNLEDAQTEILYLKNVTSTETGCRSVSSVLQNKKELERSDDLSCKENMDSFPTKRKFQEGSPKSTEGLEGNCDSTSSQNAVPSLSISRCSHVPPDSVPVSHFYNPTENSSRFQPLLGSIRPQDVDSQQSTTEKHGLTPLEVFRLPTRKAKTPTRRMRKLYSRDDDTI